ncbi:MAG: peptidase S13 [Actinomycetales bacterium]|nr:peptidase S13 [Actinomycetales bacterium]
MVGRRRTAVAVLSVALALPAASSYAGPSSPGTVTSSASPTQADAGDATAGSAGGSVGVVQAQAEVRPRIAPDPVPVLQPVSRGLPADPAVVAGELQDELGNEWLGDAAHVAVTVRDVGTGEHLVDRNVDSALTPASTTKLLAAAAVVTALPMDEGFRTRVVTGPEADQIVLVAGGDMMLAEGAGDPDRVAGQAGLGDLADQTADALRAQGLGTEESPVRLRLDTTYGEGAIRPEGWTDFWLNQGFTGPITMLGLVGDRATPYNPAPRDPAQATAILFRAALKERGIAVGGGPRTEVPRLAAPDGAQALGEVESAPARDVLYEAIRSSDNALVEQLARQAAIADGAQPDPASVRDWVVQQVADYGIDMTGVVLADVSGLSDGTTIPVRVLGDLLVLGADDSHPELQEALGGMPIAGYSGTLWDRFALDHQEPGVGVARAKTGSLPGVTSLAGVVVTQDGRLLAYAMVADEIGRDGTSALEARSVFDSMVAELAACGC